MNRCERCGRPSGFYRLCKECYDLENYKLFVNKNGYDQEDKYSNIQSLYTFDSIPDFNDFIEDLYDVENWVISDLPDRERINLLSNKLYFQTIEEDFRSSKISPYPITKKEILSYLDTLSLMYKVVNNVDNEDFFRNAKIIMEYVPNNDNGKDRCDYIITYRNLLIIFEFGRCKDRNQIKERRNIKEEELDNYKKQIKRIVSKDIIIETQAFIYQPEVNYKAEQENEQEINNTVDLIEKWLEDNYRDAIDLLNR